MGKTIVEKIFARASGGKDAKVGDFILAKVDLHYAVEDGLAEVHKKVVAAGLPNGLPGLANPDIVAIMLGDHQGCHATSHDAEAYKLSRVLVKRYGIKNYRRV